MLDLLVNGVGHLLGRVAGEWNPVESEQVRVLVAGKPAEPARRRRNLLIAHQRPVKARSAAIGHDIGDGVVNRIVFTHVVGAMIALKINRLRGIAKNNFAHRVLRRLGGCQVERFWLAGQASEIFLNNRHSLGRFNVANHREHHVGRYIVFAEEIFRVGGGKGIEIRYPAHGWSMIRMRGESF